MAGNRDRFSTFSTATRLKQLGERTAAHVYRSQTRRQVRRSRLHRPGRAPGARPLYAGRRPRVSDAPVRLPAFGDREAAAGRRGRGRRLERLRDEKARWQDNAYAEQQARKHLHFVRPGEISYIMTDPGAGAADRHRTGTAGSDRPWYSNVWDGVDKADRPGE